MAFDYIVGAPEIRRISGGSAEFRYSYLNDSSGGLYPGGVVSLPDSEAEYFILINAGVLNLTTAIPAPSAKVLAWINGSDFFGRYFYPGELPPDVPLPPQLKLPKSRTESQWVGKPYYNPINQLPSSIGESFHHQGNNYPGVQIPINSKVRYIGQWPGYTLDPAGIPLSLGDPADPLPSQIADAITQELRSDLYYQELQCQNYWVNYVDEESGNTGFWGLNREPWLTITKVAPELNRWLTKRSITNQSTGLFVNLFVSKGFYSLDGIDKWRFKTTSAEIAADLSIRALDLKGQVIGLFSPGIESVNQVFQGVPIRRIGDLWEPELDVRGFNPPLTATQYVKGYQYIKAAAAALPPGAIASSSTEFRLPRVAALPATTDGVDYFNSKLNDKSYHDACDKAKLTGGRGMLDDVIVSTAADLTSPLRLWRLPAYVTPIVGSANDAKADGVIGHEDARVCVRLPLHYKRDSVLWLLAKKLSESFLAYGEYVFGYHEFAADYSVAGEPIYRQSRYLNPDGTAYSITTSSTVMLPPLFINSIGGIWPQTLSERSEIASIEPLIKVGSEVPSLLSSIKFEVKATLEGSSESSIIQPLLVQENLAEGNGDNISSIGGGLIKTESEGNDESKIGIQIVAYDEGSDTISSIDSTQLIVLAEDTDDSSIRGLIYTELEGILSPAGFTGQYIIEPSLDSIDIPTYT